MIRLVLRLCESKHQFIPIQINYERSATKMESANLYPDWVKVSY